MNDYTIVSFISVHEFIVIYSHGMPSPSLKERVSYKFGYIFVSSFSFFHHVYEATCVLHLSGL